jgi:PKD repeat protein
MKKIRKIQFIFFLIVILNSINIANSSQEYEITGYVTTKNSSPIRRVKVELMDGDHIIKSENTNKDGFYKIVAELEENSNYRLRASSSSIQTKVVAFDTTQAQISMDITINQYPVADINSPSVGYVNDLLLFSASGSYDPDDDPLTFMWDFGDGNISDEENPTHMYDHPGDFKVTLQVEDNDGALDSDSKKIEISNKENKSPTAAANGPYTGYIGYGVEFSSEGSMDPDGEIQSYYWEFEDGQKSNSPSPTITFDEIGLYSVSLTVTDADGVSDTDTTTVDVQDPPPMPPIAKSNGPYNGRTNTAIHFSSAGSYDPDGGPLEYYWTFGNGESSDETNPNNRYPKPGTYTVTLMVTDLDNETDSDTTTCIVKSPATSPSPPPNPNKQPVAIGQLPLTGILGQTIQFSSSSYDPDGEIVKYNWSFGDGFISDEKDPIHVYNETGSYQVLLKVYDNEDESDIFSSEIKILKPNIPPVVSLNVPLSGKTNVSIQFPMLECFDTDGEITTYSWSFGDNSTSNLETPWHTYSSPGIYYVSISVTDDSGALTSAFTAIDIIDNLSPIPVIDSQQMIKIGQAIEFSALASYDMDGEIIEYRWDFGDGTISYYENIQHVFIEEGEKNVTLTVTDDSHATNEAYTSILVALNIPPDVIVNNSRIGRVYEEMEFVSESFDIDGEVVSTFWDFGEGALQKVSSCIITILLPAFIMAS